MYMKRGVLFSGGILLATLGAFMAWAKFREPPVQVPPTRELNEEARGQCSACGLEPWKIDAMWDSALYANIEVEAKPALLRILYEVPEGVETCDRCIDAVLHSAGIEPEHR